MSEGTQRRLAAILAADVVGYSRLMGEDEVGTLAALRQLRSELFASTVGAYRGSVVKSMGDGWLVTFDSAADAVACAIVLQEALADHETIKLRVSIHVGDVTHADEDVFGDGVNIAARLQEVVEPGAIIISDTARRSIDGKLAADFNDLGPQELKNIAEPVTAFGWGMSQIEERTTGLALPDKPSIAVLPFDNMSDDPEQEYFSDGIAEDVITALSRFHQFFVIARNSSFTYKGTAVSVRRVSQELGVQYVLEGSVRRARNRVRITVQLIDTANGNHIWVERYDRELDDVFAIQDEITERIATSIAPRLELVDIARARRKQIPDLGVWELIAQALWHYDSYSENGLGEAEELLEKALALDPGSSRAHAHMATCYIMDGIYGWRRPQSESQDRALELAQRALELDKGDEYAKAQLGFVLFNFRRFEQAIQMYEAAIEINPNYSRAYGQLGVALIYTHEGARGLELVQMALRLSPREGRQFMYMAQIGVHHFIEERYVEAVAWAEKSLLDNPKLPTAFRLLAAAHGMLGNLDQARAAYEQLDELLPGVSILSTRNGVAFAFEDDERRYLEGLRRAGIPEE
jgi:adenylate cyclase